MKKDLIRNKFETGQMLPLVVLLIFVIIGMAALILDGGSIMSNRRAAKAAADAGALAGAQRICNSKSDAKAVAEHYAITINHATTAEATVIGGQVTVKTTMENQSFFAKIFGEQTLRATAETTAGCYGVRGKAVVPLAWYCRAPSVGGPFPTDYGCQMQTLDWDNIGPMVDPGWKPSSERKSEVEIKDFAGNPKVYTMSGTNIVDSAGLPPDQIYIIIDSSKICIEDGGDFLCDLDGDGKKDLSLGGDRGWLYLTADTSSISNWILDEASPSNLTIEPHIWLSGKSGVATSVYTDMINAGYPGRVVLVPVYNVLCNGDPRTDTTCVTSAHESPPWPAFSGEDDFSQIRNTTVNYHIVVFQPFYVSCVALKGECPGFRYAQSLNSALTDGPVIEGFFIADYDVSIDITSGCSINLGNCTISLSK